MLSAFIYAGQTNAIKSQCGREGRSVWGGNMNYYLEVISKSGTAS